MPHTHHQDMANAIRMLAVDAVAAANSGHSGMPMGFADVATVLFTDFLRFNAADTNWADRDRFILSAGHGSMLIYSLLNLTGVSGVSLEQLKNFRQLGSNTAGHPEFGHTPGVETTTGPLGQGIANAVGFAIAEAQLEAEFGSDLVNHNTYVMVGDGCLMEGVSQEAITLAGHLKLNKLIALWDDNGITIDGSTDLSTSDDQRKRFEAAGWDTFTCDGHDAEDIARAIAQAKASLRPAMVACRTTIAFGSSKFANTSKGHGAITSADDVADIRDALEWRHPAFVVPGEIRSAWEAVGAKGADQQSAWEHRVETNPNGSKLISRLRGTLPEDLNSKIKEYIEKLVLDRPTVATRVASGKALEVLVESVPSLIGGSADLTGSNNTKIPGQTSFTIENRSGRYLNYGVREHGMAACMNGLALHGGFIPYAGTFLVFSDYARPAIRLSALMGIKVVYVMTHDSIGVGEDGPTHQPVEQVSSLRAIPNLLVMRPADTVEAMECWKIALTDGRPTVMVLSRQSTPHMRNDVSVEWASYGGYIHSPSSVEGDRQVTLMSSGTELHIAKEAQKILESEGIATAVVSMPCMEIFSDQPAHYRSEVLGDGTLRIAIEAGVAQGWYRWMSHDDAFVGMSSFGASAPASDLYNHFGITADAVVEAVRARL